MTSLEVTAREKKVKHSGESILFGFDFTNLLVSGETITGAVSASEPSNELSITGAAVNTSTFDNDDDEEVAAGTAGKTYTVTVSAVTSAGNTRKLVCILLVKDS